MAQYPIPKEIQPLARLMTDFSHACGYDPLTVFNDFLAFVIHGFSPGAPPLKSWKYKRQQNAAFMGMVNEWVRLMQSRLKEDDSWMTRSATFTWHSLPPVPNRHKDSSSLRYQFANS